MEELVERLVRWNLHPADLVTHRSELCFPDDAGLSRQHMVLERDGDDWTVQDLGSKNGTLVNNIRCARNCKLKPGDRITAGHLAIVFDDK
jgi:pSer/pThr/pTyr-binding forkhead associated (FHA) protein